MLITAKHLLAIIALVLCGTAAAALIAEWNDIGAVLATLLVPAFLGWPVFRLLSLRPLILPMCPHCERRHCNYHVPRDAWPVAVLLCAWCGKPLRLVLRTGADPVPPSEVPTITLRRPGFLGLWRKADLTS
jgi:hypothetical protein